MDVGWVDYGSCWRDTDGWTTGWVESLISLNLLFGALLPVFNRHCVSTTERNTFLQNKPRSNDV